jgi:hypothetical protein
MKIRNLLTAGTAALALALTAPATAQPVRGQVTIGVGTPQYNTYNDWNRNGIDDRYENSYGYSPSYGYSSPYGYSYNNNGFGALAGAILSIPLGSHATYAGTCGFNKVELRLNNISYNRGRVVLARDFGNNGLRVGERLFGKSFWPTAGRVCVNARDVSYNRVAIVHDVNNNGMLDFQDGIGRISYGAFRGYNGRQVVNVNFDYRMRF